MKWYITLSIHQRIALKESCHLIVGISWDSLGKIFTMRERIEILYGKLQKEGILK
jgi:hypothetical protein